MQGMGLISHQAIKILQAVWPNKSLSCYYYSYNGSIPIPAGVLFAKSDPSDFGYFFIYHHLKLSR